MTPPPSQRAPLSRDRILATAVDLADRTGLEGVSMRHLATELGVVPMALYKHIANKEALLDGLAEALIAEIPPAEAGPWKAAVRTRILAARAVLLAHPWAAEVITTRTTPSPAALAYLDSMAGTFRQGGVSAPLTHLAMHALGSRLWGFTIELYPSPPPADPEQAAAAYARLATAYPFIADIAAAATHRPDSIVGAGCDDQLEFEFALDLLLDGIEALSLTTSRTPVDEG